MAKQYKVLGEEGSEVELNGENFPGGVGHTIELEDSVAEAAIAEGKVEALPEEGATGTGGEGGGQAA